MRNTLVVVGVIAYIIGGVSGVNASTKETDNIVYTTISKLFNDCLSSSNLPANFETRLENLQLQINGKVDTIRGTISVLETEIEEHNNVHIDDSVFVAMNLALLDTISYVSQIMNNIEEIKAELARSKSDKYYPDVEDNIREIYNLLSAVGGSERVVMANKMHCLKKMCKECPTDEIEFMASSSYPYVIQHKPTASSSSSSAKPNSITSNSGSSSSSTNGPKSMTVGDSLTDDELHHRYDEDTKSVVTVLNGAIDKLNYEVANLKEEMKKSSEETNKRFEETKKEFKEMREEMGKLTALFKEFLKKK
ncbi:MAG: hypothetical protein LBP31_01445 [Holosporales bacterium]|jgi:methyl-accepting chemotaxis protein|nr:hypothetical protein [Holosporales bacterium]